MTAGAHLQSDPTDGPPASPGAPRFFAAIRFTIEGDLRFLSHHDELRMLIRTLVRARWPVAHSEGYNPQPRISIPLPRNVGTASECEWAIVRLSEPRPADQLAASLEAALPNGCTLCEIHAPAAAQRPQPRRAVYATALASEDALELNAAIQRLLAAETWEIERELGPRKPTRRLDLRQYIETIEWDGRELRMTLGFVKQGSARPSEILNALDLPVEEYAHRVRRVKVEWDRTLIGPANDGPDIERDHLGQETDDQADEEKDHDRA